MILPSPFTTIRTCPKLSHTDTRCEESKYIRDLLETLVDPQHDPRFA